MHKRMQKKATNKKSLKPFKKNNCNTNSGQYIYRNAALLEGQSAALNNSK